MAELPNEENGQRAAREAIERALEGLQYGEVRVIVHEGYVTQVERLERRRLPRLPAR
jgi:hypothetical protein